jgi:undecaprenyl phosphate N,N'-diacetylbacillosamine 1-phosphate transferase
MSKKAQLMLKRAADTVISSFLLIVLTPVFVVTALAIKLTSRGPVFFIQERPGQHAKIFRVYKFRTMRPGSEVMVKGKEVFLDDDRITQVGRFLRRTKIDELPQLINVVRGEMSLVGPRPERIASLQEYDDEIAKRLNMRPGMTGLAQVSGNIYLDLTERYKLDVHYVENFSLWLDIRILARTFGVVVLGEQRFVDRPLIDLTNRTRNVVA